MDYYLIFGMVAVALIALLGFIYVIRQNAQKEVEIFTDLKICITKLSDEIKAMRETDTTRDKRIEKHGEKIDKLDNRVGKLETKMDMYHND